MNPLFLFGVPGMLLGAAVTLATVYVSITRKEKKFLVELEA